MICVYMYLSLSLYLSISLSLSLYIYIYIYMHTCVYTYIYIYIYIFYGCYVYYCYLYDYRYVYYCYLRRKGFQAGDFADPRENEMLRARLQRSSRKKCCKIMLPLVSTTGMNYWHYSILRLRFGPESLAPGSLVRRAECQFAICQQRPL